MSKQLVARAYTGVKSFLALVGLVAIGGLMLLPLQGDTLARLPTLGGDTFFEPAKAVSGPIQPQAESPLDREQRALTEYIAKRYRVSEMAIESRYNPVAESTMGAKGLMQVIPKYHLEKLMDHGGEHALLEPEVNILVGTQILREYYRRFRDMETALQMYAGAFDEPTSQYANKVFAERARLEVLRQKAKKQPQQSA